MFKPTLILLAAGLASDMAGTGAGGGITCVNERRHTAPLEGCNAEHTTKDRETLTYPVRGK